MAILGTLLDRENPEFTKSDFLFWMPQFTSVTNIDTVFENLYPIANDKIFYSIFGVDWKYAMSLAIAHYMYVIGQSQLNVRSGAKSLADIAGGSPTTGGIMTTASIGGFSKSYDLDRSMISGDDKIWWNQSSYGRDLMNLLATKSVATMFVVTSNPVPGSGNY
jgi:hypothetical protein